MRNFIIGIINIKIMREILGLVLYILKIFEKFLF